MWRGWLGTIEKRLKPVPSIRFEYIEPVDLSNKAPQLRVHWQTPPAGMSGTELAERLDQGTPRILIGGATGQLLGERNSLTIMPYMMDPGEDRIIADRIYECLLTFPLRRPLSRPPASASLTGSWAVTVQYLRGEGEQKFTWPCP